MNAVEREPVPTRILYHNASEASYDPKHRSYRKTMLIKKPAGKKPAWKRPSGENTKRGKAWFCTFTDFNLLSFQIV